MWQYAQIYYATSSLSENSGKQEYGGTLNQSLQPLRDSTERQSASSWSVLASGYLIPTKSGCSTHLDSVPNLITKHSTPTNTPQRLRNHPSEQPQYSGTSA
ncbi:hypothetical protein ACJQWK_06121 [Exserohilum turcicum]